MPFLKVRKEVNNNLSSDLDLTDVDIGCILMSEI